MVPYFTGPLKIVKKELNTITVCDSVLGEDVFSGKNVD